MTGALRLRDYPGETVRLVCDKCGRAGKYRKQKLIEQFGADIPLPDLRHLIAKCERMGSMSNGCGVGYPALAAKVGQTLFSSGS